MKIVEWLDENDVFVCRARVDSCCPVVVGIVNIDYLVRTCWLLRLSISSMLPRVIGVSIDIEFNCNTHRVAQRNQFGRM
jgi:hypothetical protein